MQMHLHFAADTHSELSQDLNAPEFNVRTK